MLHFEQAWGRNRARRSADKHKETRPDAGFAEALIEDAGKAMIGAGPVDKLMEENRVSTLGRGAGFGMPVGTSNHYRLDKVAPRHFLQSAKKAGFCVPLVETLLYETHARVPAALEAALAQLPASFPDDVAAPIIKGIETRHRVRGLGIDVGAAG